MIVPASLESIERAAHVLAQGDLIGLPTETVYGLAADASNASAVAKIYALKQRPSDHPLIVHLASQADVSFWASAVPSWAQAFMDGLWPGPLTLVLPRSEQAGDFITGGQHTVALRCPSHPVAQAVLQAAGRLGVHGVAAPSANRFGRVSPTTAEHVETEFEIPPLILQGGACEVGIESTIVDCTGGSPRILRQGCLTAQALQAVCGQRVGEAVGQTDAPRVSGSLTAHYAPNTPLVLCDANTAEELPASAVFFGFSRPQSLRAQFVQAPQDANLYARQLYASLRHLDGLGFSSIGVQLVPDLPVWAGVADRLVRAAATFSFVPR